MILEDYAELIIKILDRYEKGIKKQTENNGFSEFKDDLNKILSNINKIKKNKNFKDKPSLQTLFQAINYYENYLNSKKKNLYVELNDLIIPLPEIDKEINTLDEIKRLLANTNS